MCTIDISVLCNVAVWIFKEFEWALIMNKRYNECTFAPNLSVNLNKTHPVVRKELRRNEIHISLFNLYSSANSSRLFKFSTQL